MYEYGDDKCIVDRSRIIFIGRKFYSAYEVVVNVHNGNRIYEAFLGNKCGKWPITESINNSLVLMVRDDRAKNKAKNKAKDKVKKD